MSALKRVLAMFEDASTPLSINEIARQLGVEAPLVDDMIAFWVRKGKLRDTANACTPDSCNRCVRGANGCPFVVPMPKRYECARSEQDFINLRDIQ